MNTQNEALELLGQQQAVTSKYMNCVNELLDMLNSDYSEKSKLANIRIHLNNTINEVDAILNPKHETRAEMLERTKMPRVREADEMLAWELDNKPRPYRDAERLEDIHGDR